MDVDISAVANSNETSWMTEELKKDLIFRMIMEMYPEWHVLPKEKCELLILANGSLWTMLNSYSVSTTGNPVSCLHHAPKLDLSKTVQAIILGIMFLISLVGNTLMIYGLSRKRKSREYSCTIYYLIFHLSIADLLVTFTCLFGEAVWKYSVSWLADNFTCKLLKCSQMFSLYLSTFVLVLIGLDRLSAVKYPMKAMNRRKKCSRHVMFIWVLSFLLSTPQLAVFQVHRGPFYEKFYQCVTYGSYEKKWHEHLYIISSIFLMFIIPLIIIIWSYVCTLITLTRSEKQFQAEMESRRLLPPELNRRRLIHKARTKSIRIFLVIVVAFVLCWAPYYFTMIVFQFHEPDRQVNSRIRENLKRRGDTKGVHGKRVENKEPRFHIVSHLNRFLTLAEDLRNGIFFFGMSNSLINPVIYGAFHLRKPRHKTKTSKLSRNELALFE